MHFLSEYGLYLAKTVTWVGGILILTAGIFAILTKNKDSQASKLKIKNKNEHYETLKKEMASKILPKKELKAFKKSLKENKKETHRQKTFLLSFDGDIKAKGVSQLREEITALLTMATPNDEVVINIDSPGGIVNGYGLAASQLNRIKEKGIPLTVCIDKMAASGGYLMASVANKILAAPFAIIGSIGVVGQIPNIHRLLKKNNIDFEQITAGEFKRTLTVFGENTDKGRKKFQEDIENIHHQFKTFVLRHRPQLNIEEVATGEHWLASDAIKLGLVDELTTSDDYLSEKSITTDIYEITYKAKMKMTDKLFSGVRHKIQSLVNPIYF